MDSFAPTTHDYGLLALPLVKAAQAFDALFAQSDQRHNQREVYGQPDDLFATLEPLSMAVDRTLLLANGESWTSYFANGLLGSDVFLTVSRIAAAHDCTGLRLMKAPDATIFEAYENQARGGDQSNYRRSISAVRDGDWRFSASGAPYPFEDTRHLAARRIKDRFTPEHLDAILVGLGAPREPLPATQMHRGILFTQDGKAPNLKRWTYAEVQAGDPWNQA
jgi:hypothetical protein